MDFEPEESSSYKKEEPALGENETQKLQGIIAHLQLLAEKEGCTVVELIEKYGNEESADEKKSEAMDTDKISMIAARMKAKQNSEEMGA